MLLGCSCVKSSRMHEKSPSREVIRGNARENSPHIKSPTWGPLLVRRCPSSEWVEEMFAATTWALKRLLKFVLKRNLKQWIATEIDLDQVEVQLGQGSLELREVLLNVDYINQQLVSHSLRLISSAACQHGSGTGQDP